MATPYFRYIPNFEYVNRLYENVSINAYIQTKNLFKRGALREDIFSNLSYFTKYTINGDDRPDNIAVDVYGSQYYDWVVMLSNNIINYQSEWPMTQRSFENYLNSKYINNEDLYKIHHYETIEVKDVSGFVMVPKGLQVDKGFSFTYFDTRLGIEVVRNNITEEYNNYDYEVKLEDEKRNIFLLKSDYLYIIEKDFNSSMLYKKGSSQYVNKRVVKGENIRLFQ